MELLFVVLLAAGLGLIAHYALPGREKNGVLLVPSAAAATAAIVWAGLLWAGLTFSGGWIWVFALVAAGIVSLVLALTIPRSRRIADERMFEALAHGATPGR